MRMIAHSMPTLHCPWCARPAPKPMEEASDEAMVNFYKCGACGHAWTTSKIDPSVMRHLTPLTKTAATFGREDN